MVRMASYFMHSFIHSFILFHFDWSNRDRTEEKRTFVEASINCKVWYELEKKDDSTLWNILQLRLSLLSSSLNSNSYNSRLANQCLHLFSKWQSIYHPMWWEMHFWFQIGVINERTRTKRVIGAFRFSVSSRQSFPIPYFYILSSPFIFSLLFRSHLSHASNRLERKM